MGSLLWGLITGASFALAANNRAAEMGPVFGAGARTKLHSLVLIAVVCTAGATLAGDGVVHNLGHGLLTGEELPANTVGALVVIIAAASLIVIANALKAPLSTAHVVVGAIVGPGPYFGYEDNHRSAIRGDARRGRGKAIVERP